MIYFGNCSLRLFVLTCTHIARSSFIAAERPNIQLLKLFYTNFYKHYWYMSVAKLILSTFLGQVSML